MYWLAVEQWNVVNYISLVLSSNGVSQVSIHNTYMPKYAIFTDDLIAQGVRASAAMVLTWYDCNNPNSRDPLTKYLKSYISYFPVSLLERK